MNSVTNEKISIHSFIILLFLYVFNAQVQAKEEYFEGKLLATDQINILKINSVRLNLKNLNDKNEAKECRKWKLTKAQIVHFFRLSINYSISPYHYYSQTQCDITGKLLYNREKWDFSINGGATAYWKKGEEIKYFGCKDKYCDNLFIIPYSPMD
ncbi:hypothetical protein [Commensalibacter nepenthis]|uniref:Uncharacterized protein n=1 Tax=Commensalibacter nepenthis TaxID=3043872 RepID=A0ABT6Q770_9PROT|nr:hypothetical protein [Commensalibacter sp. TBRC 10068]MDI2112737.1 hypothetical protein [Commensalibacter sp. TBRC 10068]